MPGQLIVISPDETVDVEARFMEKKPTFEQLYLLLDTDIIELVPFVYEGKKCEGYVDEEGMMKHKPVNRRAMKYDFYKGQRGGFPLVGDIAIWVPLRR
jgi:hypothetical protein